MRATGRILIVALAAAASATTIGCRAHAARPATASGDVPIDPPGTRYYDTNVPLCPSLAADTTQPVYDSAQVTVPARVARPAVPVYPPAARSRHLEGEVLATLIVNGAGCAEKESLRIVRETDPSFGDAVGAALLRFRFRAATLDGVPVRQRMTIPFSFTLAR